MIPISVDIPIFKVDSTDKFLLFALVYGEIAKWLNAADCNSAP